MEIALTLSDGNTPQLS